jgi:hypothetical protein
MRQASRQLLPTILSFQFDLVLVQQVDLQLRHTNIQLMVDQLG